jgi:small subunit ribosomal protein S14
LAFLLEKNNKGNIVAKKSVIYRQKKREYLVERFSERRRILKEAAYDVNATPKARWEAQQKLQKMSRNTSAVRLRNRCQITGRGRGVYRMFGLSRSVLRFHAMRGELPGIMKSSW